jgi:hypothetical protein
MFHQAGKKKPAKFWYLRQTMRATIGPPDILERYDRVMESLQQRLERITKALSDAGIEFAVIGGQAMILWVSSKDPDSVRTTKDIDLLVNQHDIPAIAAAAETVGMEYVYTYGVPRLVEKENPSPKRGVHFIWAGEKVRDSDAHPAPTFDEIVHMGRGIPVVSLLGLLKMKLIANRDHDRAHIRDLINVGLVDRTFVDQLPADLAPKLEWFLDDMGK